MPSLTLDDETLFHRSNFVQLLHLAQRNRGSQLVLLGRDFVNGFWDFVTSAGEAGRSKPVARLGGGRQVRAIRITCVYYIWSSRGSAVFMAVL